MQKKKDPYENLFMSELPTMQLPMIWQVIYQEAMRHNHILFTKEELTDIDSKLSNGGFELSEKDKKSILNIAPKIFTCSDFQTIRQLIANFEAVQKAIFFMIYKHTLSRWQHALKVSLN